MSSSNPIEVKYLPDHPREPYHREGTRYVKVPDDDADGFVGPVWPVFAVPTPTGFDGGPVVEFSDGWLGRMHRSLPPVRVVE